MHDTTHDPQTTLTRELRTALRHAGSFCLDFEDDAVTVRLEKRIHSSDPFENGRTSTIRFPGFKGRISPGYLDVTTPIEGDAHYSWEDSNAYEPKRGCWVITSCQFHRELRAAFDSIRTGAELSFNVDLDAFSNGYCARARLHGDVLRMTAKKGNSSRVFILDATICAHNTARFGYRL
jgi:hypothetical protein